VPPPRPVPQQLLADPLSLARARQVLTRRQLQGPAYRHLMRGAYLQAGAAYGYRERVLAFRAVLPDDAVLGDLSAAWALGTFDPRASDPVTMFLPPERRVAALADPRAESPPESLVRVLLTLGGLPRPVPQYVILDQGGRFVARVDLAWPEVRLAGEYDGAYRPAEWNGEHPWRALRRVQRGGPFHSRGSAISPKG
jgi:hypothetical protein